MEGVHTFAVLGLKFDITRAVKGVLLTLALLSMLVAMSIPAYRLKARSIELGARAGGRTANPVCYIAHMPAPKILKKTGYMATLDGWRAVSILAVLLNHSKMIYIRGHHALTLQQFGGEGVYIFFAISGLLICSRILEEEQVLGRVNLRGFYIRRFLRIQPTAIVYLLAVAALMGAGWISQRWDYWFGSLFLYRNYQIQAPGDLGGFFTGHFWTLAVEEHFYLLLSLFLFFVRQNRIKLLTVFYILTLIWPVVFHYFWRALDAASGERTTDLRLQYLIPTTLIALLLRKPDFPGWAKRWLKPFPVIGGTILLASCAVVLRHWVSITWIDAHPFLSTYIPPTFWDIYLRFYPLWVVATVLNAESLISRFLELSLLRWIGRISYSLYLWHVLFFRGPWPDSIAQPASPLLFLTRAPWNLIAAILCAVGSFYLLERPFMRLGHRLAPPSTPGRKDMEDLPSIEAAIETGTLQ